MFGSCLRRTIYKQFRNERIVWNVLKNVEMPMDRVDMVKYECVRVFDNVVFAFCYSDNLPRGSIWCLDMLTMQWNRSSIQIPCKCLLDLCCGEASLFCYAGKIYVLKGGCGYLFQIHAIDLLPDNIIISHRRYCEKLIKGFVREQEFFFFITCSFDFTTFDY